MNSLTTGIQATPATAFSETPLQSRSVTIAIPSFNEEGNLERLFLLLENTFRKLKFDLPVLLIDDGSTDSSPEILTGLMERYAFLRVIRHPSRRGVTEVWRTAIANIHTDWILWGQADLESNPETDIPLLLEACVPGVDAVAGRRLNRGDGKVRASKLANWACQKAFNLEIHDMNWIKLVRRDRVAKLPLQIITHRYLLAILAGIGCKVTEVTTPWHPRHSGTSKFGRKRFLTSAVNFITTWLWFQIEGSAYRDEVKMIQSWSSGPNDTTYMRIPRDKL
ncbi:glycosyltransferase family 2 protein [Pseudanabaena sp. PCC 6802]|uniref:glycosyltransferase family 2 protein n=1 Tax=Pseudanabaena sp. PCC 6802 TaxID=118173 RepID=UPI00034C75C0|nr:glycosyltransferase family 2 protein [Pseudanabaena sp. PCC 6802]